jgi:DNA-binding beta-propeller fold protein YncE
MTETFDCASCSAPLDFEGTAVQKCKFCGSTVIVPSHLVPGSTPVADSLGEIARNVAEVRRLIAAGNKIPAIKLFRETFGVGLKEAKDAVDAMEQGIGVDISAMPIETARGVSTADLKAVRNAGLAISGSILGTIGLILLATIAIIVLILFFVFRVVERTVDPAISSSKPAVVDNNTSANKITELLRFGGDGTGAGRFKDNRHVGTDRDGNIYSIDYQGARMQVFDRSGKFITQWQAGPADIAVRGMAVSRDGIVYISDVKGITAFNGQSGETLSRLDRYQIYGLTVTIDGKVITAGRTEISVLDRSLKTISEFKDAAKASSARSGFDEIAADGSGNIYALDRADHQICKFAADGKFLTRFPADLGSPNAIAVDPKGNIFVANTSEIRVVDERGLPLAKLPATQAFGLAFNDEGELFIASRPFVVKCKIEL